MADGLPCDALKAEEVMRMLIEGTVCKRHYKISEKDAIRRRAGYRNSLHIDPDQFHKYLELNYLTQCQWCVRYKGDYPAPTENICI